MTPIKNVAIAGASGNLGTCILQALLDSKAFSITILSRQSSTATFPATTKVITVDYNSTPDLTAALQGQDAVISAFPTLAIGTQLPLIEAAVAAGVKRFIPSEFSADIDNPKSSTLPVYQPNIAVHKVLKAQSQAHSSFTYTLIRNGVLLDWSMARGYIVAFDSATPILYDGGDRPFSVTSMSSVARAVVGVLQRFDSIRNRVVYIHDLVITQKQVLAIAQKLVPERKWDPVTVSTADLEAKSWEDVKKGEVFQKSALGFLARAVFGEGYGGEFGRVDNEELGLGFGSEDELEELVKKALEGSAVPSS